jgi:hypothetical protein
LIPTRFPSNVESLKKGIIKTSKNNANKPYTILLVEETGVGVGKYSLLELIANVLFGNDVDHYDFNVVDHSNEQDGPGNQSQCFKSVRQSNAFQKPFSHPEGTAHPL